MKNPLNEILDARNHAAREAVEKTAEYQPPTPANDVEEIEPDNAVYGSDKTRRPKTMLSFRKANNTRRHIPYPHIYLVDESEGLFLTVHSNGCVVKVEGQNLNLVAERIKHGTLSYIQESSKTKPVYSPDGVAIFAIDYSSI
jgi:hypothetical protein